MYAIHDCALGISPATSYSGVAVLYTQQICPTATIISGPTVRCPVSTAAKHPPPGGCPPALAFQVYLARERLCRAGDGGHVQEGVQVDEECGCLCTGLPPHSHPRYCTLESRHSLPSRWASEAPCLEGPHRNSMLNLRWNVRQCTAAFQHCTKVCQRFPPNCNCISVCR